MVWQAVVNGRRLRFKLTGINNQNFLMADDATGSWWQQISGAAVQGPMRGTSLEPQPWDEITFGDFAQEHPDGLVLLPDEKEKAADNYAPADWEERMTKAKTVTPARPDDALKPRDLVIGLEVGDASRAYPRAAIAQEGLVVDTLGGAPVVLVTDDDRLAVRAFRREADGMTLDLFVVPGSKPLRFVDAQTGSTWDFTGAAIDGPLQGRRLERVQAVPDYWFDWQLYHPDADVFAGWEPQR